MAWHRASSLLGGWDESYGIDSILSATKPDDVLLTRLGDRYGSSTCVAVVVVVVVVGGTRAMVSTPS